MARVSRWASFWRAFIAVLLGGSAVHAASQAEVNAWNAAVSANTTDGYHLYLSLYPAGDYVDEAIAALGRLGAVGTARRVDPIPASPSTPSDSAGTDPTGLY